MSAAKKRNTGQKGVKPSTFGQLYGTALFRMCYLWTFNDGTDGDWPPPRHVVDENADWMLISSRRRTVETHHSPRRLSSSRALTSKRSPKPKCARSTNKSSMSTHC